jgi:BlaI family transcriptional regulator, penicillinase repressor
MARPTSKHPTELELEILKVLWRGEPLTGRQIREALREFRNLAYTSVMTVLGIMEDKGYVRRKKQAGSFVYSAKIGAQATTRRMLLDLVQRAYDGSVMSAVVNLLETSDIQAEELKQLRELIRLKSKGK